MQSCNIAILTINRTISGIETCNCIAPSSVDFTLSIEPFLELKRSKNRKQWTKKHHYQSNHFWNWNSGVVLKLLSVLSINRTISGIETSFNLASLLPYLILSIEPFLELKLDPFRSNDPSRSYQSNHFWNWNNFEVSPKWESVYSINRTISGIETQVKEKDTGSNYTINRTISGIETCKPRTLFPPHHTINRTISGIETN